MFFVLGLVLVLGQSAQLLGDTVINGPEQELLPPLPELPVEGAPTGAEGGPSTIKVVGDAFFETFTKELLRETLNNQIKDITVKGAKYAVGDVALSVLSSVEAGKDWGEAETDSQKFYAGARFVNAVLGPFTGGVSTLISLAITGNELFYRTGVAEIHERAADYAREAAESLARSEKIFTGLARAEYEQLRLLINSRVGLKTASATFDKAFEDNCKTDIQSVRDLDKCLILLEAQVLTARRLIAVELKVIGFNGSFISMSKILKQQNVDWEAATVKIQKAVAVASEKLKSVESLIAQIIQRKWTLLSEAMERDLQKMDSFVECEKYALGVSRAFQEIRVGQAHAKTEGSQIDYEILAHHMEELIFISKEKLNQCGLSEMPLPQMLRQKLVTQQHR